MQAPLSTSKPKVNCPVGAHVTRCIQVIDLGNQRFKPGDEPSNKVYICFETCEAKHTFKDEKGPEPFVLQKEFNWFMKGQKKTKLRTFIESWKGSAFPTDDAAVAFDFEKLLGIAATLMVTHVPRADGSGMRAEIAGIAPADSKTAPKPVNQLICYEIGMGEGGTFSKLPPFLQKKLRESDEFRGIKPAVKAAQTADDFASVEPEPGEPDWDTGGPATVVPDANSDFS